MWIKFHRCHRIVSNVKRICAGVVFEIIQHAQITVKDTACGPFTRDLL
jgi:hypothetical protein